MDRDSLTGVGSCCARWGLVVLLGGSSPACGGHVVSDPGSSGGASGGQPATPGAGDVSGGGTAGQSAARAPLVPLTPGHRWSFEFDPPWNATSPLPFTCEAPSAEVGAETTIDGRSGVLYTSFCAEPMLITGSFDQLVAYTLEDGQLGRSYEYIHSPVREGETWGPGGVQFTWRSVSTALPVSLDDASECWERYSPDSSFYYCRGMGLVHAVDRESGWTLALTDKNF